MAGTLPPDLVPLIAVHLHDQRALGTLSALAVLSTATYPAVSTLLYKHIHFTSDAVLRRFLQCIDPTTDQRDARTVQRRRGLLAKTRSVVLDEPPGADSAHRILAIAPCMQLQHVFPCCTHMSLHSNALDHLPSRAVSTSYNTSKLAIKTYESIRRLCRPTVLAVVRPPARAEGDGCGGAGVRPGNRPIAAQDRSLFVRRLADHWPELVRVDWGEVHLGELYAVCGARNVYRIPDCACVGRLDFAHGLIECVIGVRHGDGAGRPPPRTEIVLRGTRRVVESLKDTMRSVMEDLCEEHGTISDEFIKTQPTDGEP